MRKRFRFSLQTPDGAFYRAFRRDVSLDQSAAYIADPIEWNDGVDIRLKRNFRLHGVQRQVIVPLKFPLDGATILRYIYLTQGVEGVCIFVVEELNPTTQLYEQMLATAVDFSQFISTETVVQVAVLDDGLANTLQVKGDTPFEIPVYSNDSLRVLVDGVRLRNRSVFTAISTMQGTTVAARQFSPDMNHTFSEAPYEQDLTLTRTLDTNGPASLSTTNFVYKASYPGTIKASFKGIVSAVLSTIAAANNTFTVVAMKNSGGTNTGYTIYTGANYDGTVTSFTENVAFRSVNIPVLPGDTITLIIGVLAFTTGSSGRWAFDCTDGEFEIEYFLRQAPTEVRAYRQIQVWQKLVAAMAGPGYGITSDYLNTAAPAFSDYSPYNTVLTCGDAIRGFTDQMFTPSGPILTIPPKIKITPNQLIQDGKARDMIGVGVEGSNLRIERLPYFYDKSQKIVETLGIVSDFRMSVSSDFIFNLLKVGYQYRESDTLNGKDDPHTTSVWSTAGLRIKSELDLVSDFIASMYTIEYVRANLGKKTTTDSDKDNDIFLAELSGTVNSAGQWLLSRRHAEPGGSVSGLIAGETAFNLGLLPKRNLLRNGPRVRLAAHQMDSTSLTFQSIDQNAEVTSKLGASSALVVEKLSEIMKAFADLPFLPIDLEFRAPVPRDWLRVASATPYGVVPFDLIRHGRKIRVEAFINESIVKTGNREATVWKMLPTADTDLLALV